jgi:hypothetical protein
VCGAPIWGTDVSGFWVWLHRTRPEHPHNPAPLRTARGER